MQDEIFGEIYDLGLTFQSCLEKIGYKMSWEWKDGKRQVSVVTYEHTSPSDMRYAKYTFESVYNYRAMWALELLHNHIVFKNEWEEELPFIDIRERASSFFAANKIAFIAHKMTNEDGFFVYSVEMWKSGQERKKECLSSNIYYSIIECCHRVLFGS